jgi:DNA-binding HxlR family transcriptional regulator
MATRSDRLICPFQSLIGLLGRRHSLEILYAIQTKNPRRFTELRSATGINPSTLTQRLRELTEAGLLLREAHNEIPPRVEYGLTKKGSELARIFEAMDRWYRKFG